MTQPRSLVRQLQNVNDRNYCYFSYIIIHSSVLVFLSNTLELYAFIWWSCSCLSASIIKQVKADENDNYFTWDF